MNDLAILTFDIGGTRIKAGVVQGDAVHALQVVPLAAERQTQTIVNQLQRIGTELNKVIQYKPLASVSKAPLTRSVG